MDRENIPWKKIAIAGGVGVGVTLAVGYWYKKRKNSEESAKINALKEVGVKLFTAGEFEEALTAFERAIKAAQPGDEAIVAMCHQNRAACQEKLNAPIEDILSECYAAIKNNNNYAKAHFRLAKHLAQVNRCNDALAHLYCAITLDKGYNTPNVCETFMRKLQNNLEVEFLTPYDLPEKEKPVNLARIQPWLYNWDYNDSIKEDMKTFVAAEGNENDKCYAEALALISKQDFDAVLNVLSPSLSSFRNTLLSAKFHYYSNMIKQGEQLKLESLMIRLASEIKNLNVEKDEKLILAYYIFLLESNAATRKVKQILNEAVGTIPKMKDALTLFAVLMYATAEFEDDDLGQREDLLKIGFDLIQKSSCNSPHSILLRTNLRFLYNGLFADNATEVYKNIFEMEQLVAKEGYDTPFAQLQLCRAYFLTQCPEGAMKIYEKMKKENKIKAYMPTMYYQLYEAADPELKSFPIFQKFSNHAFEVEPYNYIHNFMTTHFCILQLENELCTAEYYKKYLPFFQRVCIFAPPSEQNTIKAFRAIFEARRKSAEILGSLNPAYPNSARRELQLSLGISSVTRSFMTICRCCIFLQIVDFLLLDALLHTDDRALYALLAEQDFNETAEDVEPSRRTVDGTEELLYRTLLHPSVYEKDVRPSSHHSQPTNVTFGFLLNQIVEMDERNQALTTRSWLNINWLDPRLVWNESDWSDIKTIYIPHSRVWKPDIILVNNAIREYHASLVSTDVMVSSEGNVTWLFSALFRSSCPIRVRYYPFDDQQCDLKFASWSHDITEINLGLNTDKGDLSSYMNNSEFDLIAMTATREVVKFPSEMNHAWPTIVIRIHMHRRPLFYVFNHIVPCVLISSMAVLGFLMPPETGEKINMIITTLLSMGVYLQSITESIPPTSEGVPLIGMYYVSSLLMVCLATCVNVITLNMHRNGAANQGRHVPFWMHKYILGYLAAFMRMTIREPDSIALLKASQSKKSTIRRSSILRDLKRVKNMANLRGSKDDHNADCECMHPMAQAYTELMYGTLVGNGTCRDNMASESAFLGKVVSEGIMPRMNASSTSMNNEFESRFRKILKRIYRSLQQHEIREEILDERARIQWQWQQLASVVDRLLLCLFCTATVLTIICLLLVPVAYHSFKTTLSIACTIIGFFPNSAEKYLRPTTFLAARGLFRRKRFVSFHKRRLFRRTNKRSRMSYAVVVACVTSVAVIVVSLCSVLVIVDDINSLHDDISLGMGTFKELSEATWSNIVSMHAGPQQHSQSPQFANSTAANVKRELPTVQPDLQEKKVPVESLDSLDLMEKTEETAALALLLSSLMTFLADASSARLDLVDQREKPDHQDRKEDQASLEKEVLLESKETKDRPESLERLDVMDLLEELGHAERLELLESYIFQELLDDQDLLESVDQLDSPERMEKTEKSGSQERLVIPEEMDAQERAERTELLESAEEKDQLVQTPAIVLAQTANSRKCTQVHNCLLPRHFVYIPCGRRYSARRDMDARQITWSLVDVQLDGRTAVMPMSGGSELWKSCSNWLFELGLLVKADAANMIEFATILRDGVLLCRLANLLVPNSIQEKEINKNQQMSQFTCMKNICLFLGFCRTQLGIEEKDLFGAADLYSMTGFANVLATLSLVSRSVAALSRNVKPFPADPEFPYASTSQRPAPEEEAIYQSLTEEVDKIDPETTVYGDIVKKEDDDEKVYDHIVARKDSRREKDEWSSFVPSSKREHCIKELLDTEQNYVDKALEMIIKKFHTPLQGILKEKEHSTIFNNIQSLYDFHRQFCDELRSAVLRTLNVNGISSRPSSFHDTHYSIGNVFVIHKKRFVSYGRYCTGLDESRETILALEKKDATAWQKIQECSGSITDNQFKLQDLLCLPMQRVLKYHLLLSELIKSTPVDDVDRQSLEDARDAMEDVNLYINEMKRDTETQQLTNEIEKSIVDLAMPSQVKLTHYGRLNWDGEVRLAESTASQSGKTKQRYVFIFDKVLVICRANRNNTYTYKNAFVLSELKADPNVSVDSKTGGTITRRLTQHVLHLYRERNEQSETTHITITFKSAARRQQWLERFQHSKENVLPVNLLRDTGHSVHFTSFDVETAPTLCSVCKRFLKGLYYQGYKCDHCNLHMHKECLGLKKCEGPRRSSDPTRTSQSFNRPRTSSVQYTSGEQVVAIARSVPIDLSFLQFEKDDRIEVIQNHNNGTFTGCVLSNRQRTGLVKYDAVHRLRSNSVVGISLDSQISFPARVQRNESTVLPRRPPENSNKVHLQRDYVNTEISAQSWYMGDMERDTAFCKLRGTPNGTFLVRYSANRNTFAISISYDGEVKHMVIEQNRDQQYYLDEGYIFNSVVELVTYYREHNLIEIFNTLNTTLKSAYRECKLYRVIHDYDAPEDPKFLSLRKGDVVTLVDTIGEDRGWWKGMINNKVGFFPLSYVEPLTEGESR
ncbi:unnamed protein product [Caenorhabditis auriculariae]|uniref:Ligand-gated ion channel 4 n=1 Tax=Caenorhabditis auriculariae TaxID=2777116 RepID=A0A8S1H0M0_9PELO|nr:unnamed protein product [Caenorhabditis auriculariae]